MIFAQTNKLEGYRVISFNGVTRVSLVFTQKPNVNIIKETHALRITITIPNCELGPVPNRFSTPDTFAKNISITRHYRDLVLEITADRTFDHVRQIDSQGRLYTVHIDIFRTMSPQLLQEITAMLDFYHYVGSTERLQELLRTALVTYPGDMELINRQQNKFPSPNIYTPPAIRPQTTQPKPQTPPQVQSPVQPPIPLQTSITTTPPPSDPTPTTPVTPNKEVPNRPEQMLPSEVNLPPISHTDSNSLSFTLITRSDRFPTRIPQTKQLLNSQIDIPPAPPDTQEVPLSIPEQPEVLPTPSDPEPLSGETITQSQPDTRIVEEIIYKTITDTSNLSDIEQLILSYYNIASIDSTLVTYLIGASANIIGDYENAIRYLTQIPASDQHYNESLKLLYDSYINLGDLDNANFIASLLPAEDINQNIGMKMWMVLSLSGLALVVGINIGFIFYSFKKKKEDNSEETDEEDFEIHKQNLQRAYETKEIFKEEPIPTPDLVPTDEYDDPPIITEELTDTEEKELIAEETPKSPEVEEELDPYADEEYRKKMILKLYHDGWKNEEIAKELQISHREIQFIIKMNN